MKFSPPSFAERYDLDRTAAFFATDNGYFTLASTKPHTIGSSLAVAGHLAWIYEKPHDWTDPRYVWTDDEICT